MGGHALGRGARVGEEVAAVEDEDVFALEVQEEASQVLLPSCWCWW